MRNCMITVGVLVWVCGSVSAADDETKQVSGRVLDESGRPAAQVTVAPVWIANGLRWDQFKDLQRAGQTRKLWENEGRMEPLGQRFAVTGGDGRFTLTITPRTCALMALDEGRKRGSLIRFGIKNNQAPIDAYLRPLVRISGKTKLTGGDKPMEWSVVYLNVPYDEAEPLAIPRIGFCGSYRSRFAFAVPPGDYVLRASSDSPSARSIEDRTFTADRQDIDLGTLVLRPSLSIRERVDRSKAAGTWVNYKDNLGKQPPHWHVTDAKGVPKNVWLSDFRGKWVLLYIWSPNCAPCLGKQLPELMKFYEAHRAHRDKFEIIAFCCDFSESIKSISELEQHLKHVKKNVWGGKDLPFPVLLDNTFQTYERLGLEGSGVSNLLLIDPEGKLIAGDLRTLESKLRSDR
ncbi:MAG: redoxin domain-containing protein [Isosphaeraceae bacterium]